MRIPPIVDKRITVAELTSMKYDELRGLVRDAICRFAEGAIGNLVAVKPAHIAYMLHIDGCRGSKECRLSPLVTSLLSHILLDLGAVRRERSRVYYVFTREQVRELCRS